ncbi:basic leucine zipper 8-like [Magnolia sinica]|uniref:basic leucine zipper 8-like n=1 Tax=Magnolia sinica TaxID=86752 RepID=UPI00265A1275|nr:basic leucine zipper 8-like [Magnolia sinica]
MENAGDGNDGIGLEAAEDGQKDQILPPSLKCTTVSSDISDWSATSSSDSLAYVLHPLSKPLPPSDNSPRKHHLLSATSLLLITEKNTQTYITDEKKHKRMISNRESARRSLIRQKKHLDELLVQVIQFGDQNCQLIDKLNHMEDCLDRIVEENGLLREEASNLLQTL